jgi:hypothetical protein
MASPELKVVAEPVALTAHLLWQQRTNVWREPTSPGRRAMRLKTRTAGETGRVMKKCAQCHGPLGLGVRSRNVWNGRWWVYVLYCSTHCEALHALERYNARGACWRPGGGGHGRDPGGRGWSKITGTTPCEANCHAPKQPAMRSPDKEREPVPVASDAERPLPNAWRDVPRRPKG